MNAEKIGKRIRARRAQLLVEVEKRMTLSDLSDLTGITPAHLSRIESGGHIPQLDTIERIAAALQISVADLIED